MMSDRPVIPILLLLAFPASGKTELRKYLHEQGEDYCRKELGIGPTLDLDDYPYVALMRRVDEIWVNVLHGGEPIFFQSLTGPFRDPYEWGTLIQLLNEDYSYLLDSKEYLGVDARDLFTRIDNAELCAGAKLKLGRLPEDVLNLLASYLEEEAKRIRETLQANQPETLEGRTVVIEFARGGACGAPLPLDPPHGYGWALRQLDPEILEQASVLYVWVTPEQSRMKNAARAFAPPGRELEIDLFHGVPLDVMLRDYGCDDMRYLLGYDLNWEEDDLDPEQDNEITLEAHGATYVLPTAILDNREDLTTFIREESDPECWDVQRKLQLRQALQDAFTYLVLTSSEEE